MAPNQTNNNSRHLSFSSLSLQYRPWGASSYTSRQLSRRLSSPLGLRTCAAGLANRRPRVGSSRPFRLTAPSDRRASPSILAAKALTPAFLTVESSNGTKRRIVGSTFPLLLLLHTGAPSLSLSLSSFQKLETYWWSWLPALFKLVNLLVWTHGYI